VKVLITCPYDWGAPGGVQIHVRELAARLFGAGHEVRVLAPGRGSPVEGWVRYTGRPLPVSYAGTVAPICPRPSSLRQIRAEVRAFGPDIVHVHEPFAPSTSLFATLVSDVPVVATFHAYLDRSRLLTATRPLLRRVWRRIAVSIAVSEAAASFSARRFGGEVSIVPNGVEVERFASGTPRSDLPEGPKLLWVNRLDPQKGFRVALRAFDILVRQFPQLAMIVAGDGPDRSAIAELPAPVRGRLVMLGNVPHDELPGYFASADVFVSPAVGQESFGMVLVEAMAAGVPVVATDIRGYSEVVRPDTEGLLVPPGNAIALAVAVRRVLLDPRLAERYGAAGRSRAARFSWDEVVPQVEAVYHSALAAKIGS